VINANYFSKYSSYDESKTISEKITVTHISELYKPTYNFDNKFDTYEYVYFFTNSKGEKAFIYESNLKNNNNKSKKETSEKLLLNCMYGDQHIEKIEELIKSGADVNYADPYSGITPLIIALEYQNTRTIQILLEHGADPNKKDFEKKSYNDHIELNLPIDAIE
jgi:ankyrin repeat protein